MINPYAPQAFHGSKVAMALVEAIAFSTDQSGMAIYDVDHADATLLPHLIKQFSLEEYALWNQFGEAGIREIIKNALPIVRHKGTPWAVNFALGLAGVRAEIKEWWERNPTGDPYTADIIFWANENRQAAIDIAQPDRFAQIEAIVEAVRPATRRFTIYAGYRFPITGEPGEGTGLDATNSLGVAAIVDVVPFIKIEVPSAYSALVVDAPLAVTAIVSPRIAIEHQVWRSNIVIEAVTFAVASLSPRILITHG
jgi:phage tail P2-like protein